MSRFSPDFHDNLATLDQVKPFVLLVMEVLVRATRRDVHVFQHEHAAVGFLAQYLEIEMTVATRSLMRFAGPIGTRPYEFA